MNAPVDVQFDGSIATVTLNRPAVLNAIDSHMAQGLAETASLLESRTDIRVIVIAGAGPSFCAGGDVAYLADNLDRTGAAVTELLQQLHRFLLVLRSTNWIVVTRVHGSAAGAGLSLALMADFCIASDDARFIPAYAALGVSPDAGGTVGLTDAVGPRRALQILLGGRHYSGTEAQKLGLVWATYPASELSASATAFARELAELPPSAVRHTKALLYRSSADEVAKQLDAEMAALIECMSGDSFRENARRFCRTSRNAAGEGPTRAGLTQTVGTQATVDGDSASNHDRGAPP